MNDIDYIDQHIDFLKQEIENNNGGYRKMLKESLRLFEEYRRGLE